MLASSAAWASPTASAPIEIRPPSRILRNVLKPSPCVPSRFAAGIRAPSKRSSPVAEACRPSLSSSRPTLNPGVSAGTMNALISASPLSVVPVLAVIDVRAGVPGVRDEALCAVEHPASRPSSRAVVRVPPASEPAPGLGQAVRAEDLAARHRDEVALLLLVACRPGGAGRSRGSCGPRRSARANPTRGRSPRSRSRRPACRDRPRPRPRGSGCPASRARRCAARCRSGSVARARAPRRPARPRSCMKSRMVSRSSACSGARSRSIGPSLSPQHDLGSRC